MDAQERGLKRVENQYCLFGLESPKNLVSFSIKTAVTILMKFGKKSSLQNGFNHITLKIVVLYV